MMHRRRFSKLLSLLPALIWSGALRADTTPLIKDYETSLENIAWAAFGDAVDDFEELSYKWLRFRKNLDSIFVNTLQIKWVRDHVIAVWRRDLAPDDHLHKCPLCNGHAYRLGRGTALEPDVPPLEPNIRGALWKVGRETLRCDDWGVLNDPEIEAGPRVRPKGRLWYRKGRYWGVASGKVVLPAERAG